MERENDVLPRQVDENASVFFEKFTDSEYKSIIRSLNLKVTPQRLLIIRILKEGGHHVTAQELYEKIVRLDSGVGFATVYRFLRDLSDKKIITEVRMGGFPARFEWKSKIHHDHLTCTHCGQIYEFENKSIEKMQEKVALEFGFILTHHILELYGTCSSCQSAVPKIG